MMNVKAEKSLSQWCSVGGTRGNAVPPLFFRGGTRSLAILQHFWHFLCWNKWTKKTSRLTVSSNAYLL